MDLWTTTRATRTGPWGTPVNLGTNVNSTADDGGPTISPDGLELYFCSWRSGGYGSSDLYVTRRATTSSPWEPATNLGALINGPGSEAGQSLSPDGLLLVFGGQQGNPVRPGGYGNSDLLVTRRTGLNAPSSIPLNLGPVINSASHELAPLISPDGSTFFFNSTRPDVSTTGNGDSYQALILPVTDFNGDGNVDGTEVMAIVAHLGLDDPVCDIGPTAFGDGVVDLNDLIVLAGYIGTEEIDPTLQAHWALDEGVGSAAVDYVGGHDAMIVGDAVWQPDGMVDGALALDGTHNFMRTLLPVLDPAKGPFSAIAWVKGGAADRVIVSQYGGADWLYLDQYGMLATDLRSSGGGQALRSDAFVLDDQWHRVALVYDGTSRALYLDGEEVEQDPQPNLAASSGNLQIGAGKDHATATLWSGLVDDVRIYNRAVRP